MLVSTCSMRLRTAAGGEVPVARVHGLEPAAVDGHDASGQETDLPAEHHEVPAGRAKRIPVLASEVGDRLKVGCEAADQPHQFDIAAGLPLQAPAGRDLVQVAVQVELQ